MSDSLFNQQRREQPEPHEGSRPVPKIVLTVIGLQFGSLLAGAIVTEIIFSWPGIGRLTISAIYNRDYALVQGCILAVGLTYVAVNLLTDVAYTIANPRMRM